MNTVYGSTVIVITMRVCIESRTSSTVLSSIIYFGIALCCFGIVESFTTIRTRNQFVLPQHSNTQNNNSRKGYITTPSPTTINVSSSISVQSSPLKSVGDLLDEVPITDIPSKAAANILKTTLLQSDTNDDINSRKEQIESLIQRLIQEKVQFNPRICLNGPLYTVLYQSGPIPFWEKYDLKFLPIRNLKGQQYTAIDPTKEEDDDDEVTTRNEKRKSRAKYDSFDLINYAEFWSTNLSIQGCGVCTFLQANNTRKKEDDVQEKKDDQKDNFFASFFSLSPISSSLFNNQQSEKTLLQCPVDYKVEIQNASVSFLGKKFGLNVNGIGYTRILYADEEMRILLAPEDTSDERWMEKAGLVVVQIRSDLVIGSEVILTV